MLESLPETAEPEVVREVQPRRQAHSRRIRIELPGMHRQDGGDAGAFTASIARSTRRGELIRRPQPQPIGIA